MSIIAFINTILAPAFGLFWNLFNLPVSGRPSALLQKVAGSAGPVALFVLGASLTRYKLEGNIGDILSLATFKLIVFPLFVGMVATFIGNLPHELVVICIVIAALPAGVNAYLIADYYKTGVAVNSGNILLTTVLSVFTLPAILYIFR